MDFRFRATDDIPSTYLPSSSNFSFFTEQALRAGYSSMEFRRNEVLRNPSDVREVVLRELEKEQIRGEIIAAEVARRRELEDEVRKELMFERELALRRAAAEDFPLVSPFPIAASAKIFEGFGRFESRLPLLGQFDARSLEERIAFPIRRDLSAALDLVPFQRRLEAQAPEVKSASEPNKEKVIILAKPDQNLSGVKRKSLTPPALGTGELPAAGQMKKFKELPAAGQVKKFKEEWSCALCQVSATCEQGLDEHLQGKKHKAKEAGLMARRAGKNSFTALPKRAAKVVEGTAFPNSEQQKKMEDELQEIKRIGETSLLNENTEDLNGKKNDKKIVNKKEQDAGDSKKEHGEILVHKMQNTFDPNKRKFRFWCEMCKIGAYSEGVMDNHKRGRKHIARLLDLGQTGGSVLAATIQPSPAGSLKDEIKEVSKQDEKTA
ncbi:uncharacterized protein LOC131157032 [Malania oleifera]|uniref:uncharacterized protein LOC131157032 n=1 Tax=Malania oleifera TaxID=397392 RepID=UPI0025ADCB00|nr:uncharacterized protein LOC131157032 [Malania oleifera]